MEPWNQRTPHPASGHPLPIGWGEGGRRPGEGSVDSTAPSLTLEQIDRIEIHTHESALRIIDKTGPLHNPADRDHCLQYMTAIGFIFGALTADHYEDATAADPRIDAL